MPYLAGFVGMRYGDEPADIVAHPAGPATLPAVAPAQATARQADMFSAYREWNARYPDAMAYTNCYGTPGFPPGTLADLTSYMRNTRPDMIMFDYYPAYSFPERDRANWYSVMQRYRTAGLQGNDGTSSSPIPYAQWLCLFRSDYADPLPSESFVRLQQFASWVFGFTFVEAFPYDSFSNVRSAIFSSDGDASPTPVFAYVAEANRQSRNLGPALVRLLSTGIYMKPGSGRSVSGTELVQWAPHSGNSGKYVDHLTAIAPYTNSVPQGGVADPSYDDVLVGYFKPLLPTNPACSFVDGLHFMIVNGATGTPTACNAPGDSAAKSTQWYHLTFDFSGSPFDSLVRLSRETGRVELVTLTHYGNAQDKTYFLDLNLPGGTGDLFAFWDSKNPRLPTICHGQNAP
jgi:hypothetical protein